MNLSDRQVRMLAFIRSYLEEHAYPPTIREIGKAVGIPSTSVVKYNLERLQEKGFIERSGEVSRGLRLKDGPTFGGHADGDGVVRNPEARRHLGRPADRRVRPAGRPVRGRDADADRGPRAATRARSTPCRSRATR